MTESKQCESVIIDRTKKWMYGIVCMLIWIKCSKVKSFTVYWLLGSEFYYFSILLDFFLYIKRYAIINHNEAYARVLTWRAFITKSGILRKALSLGGPPFQKSLGNCSVDPGLKIW